jgi:hypothetical protein
MVEKFLIIEVPPEAPESIEEMGSKRKFWFSRYELKRHRYLYKQVRQNTGEDWAEKIASELCKLLALPHADYELATFKNERGIISPSFLPEEGSLELGNEILAPIVPDYPQAESFKVSQHTIENIFAALTQDSVNLPLQWTPPNDITTSAEVFVGYLLLDAWVGNSDRHHENWAFIRFCKKTYLAPTYDHASSMGREILDHKRLLKLNNKSVTSYVEKCTSAIYASVEDERPLKTFDVFREARQRYPKAASVWLDNLAKVSSDDTLKLFQRIPSERISETAIKFAQKILELNQHRLLKLRNIIP